MPEEIIGCLPEKGWISAEALAAYLNCSTDAVKRYCQRYNVRRIVIAGKWLIDIDDLMEK